jgi:peptide/histidine transporter 3/4
MKGMFFATASIIIAGIVETKRDHITLMNSTIVQVIDNTTYLAADFSVLWQIPQYTLIGLSEVFCSVTGLYYAYSAAPKSMQSIITGFYYLFMGIGSFLGSVLLFSFHDLIYSRNGDINCENCHLDYYFYTLGSIQFLFIIIYWYLDFKFGLTKLDNDVPCSQKTDSKTNSKKLRSFVKVANYKTINDRMF